MTCIEPPERQGFKKPPHELIEWLPEDGYDDDESEEQYTENDEGRLA